MKHFLLFFSGLFLASASLQSMEITKADFVFKRKERGFFGSLCYPADNRSLVADFATTADSNRTFANHELLWAKRMNDEEIIPQDITNKILKIRYHQIINNNLDKIDKDYAYKNIFWLNKGQQKAVYYLIHHADTKPVKIEGATIQFSQEVTRQIDSIPPKIKKTLFKEDYYYVKTSEPTFIDECLGKGETRKNNINFIANLITGVGLVGAIGALAATELEKPTRSGYSLGCMATGATLHGLTSTSNYIHNTFTPKDFDEEMTMFGFEKRSLFPTLEYKNKT